MLTLMHLLFNCVLSLLSTRHLYYFVSDDKLFSYNTSTMVIIYITYIYNTIYSYVYMSVM